MLEDYIYTKGFFDLIEYVYGPTLMYTLPEAVCIFDMYMFSLEFGIFKI